MTIESDYSDSNLEESKKLARTNQMHITYGYFDYNSRNEYVYLFTKQCLQISSKIYKLQDIYGYESEFNGIF